MHFATFLIIPKDNEPTEELVESYMEKYYQDNENYYELSIEVEKKDMKKEAEKILKELIKNPETSIEDLFNKIDVYKKMIADKNYLEVVKRENDYKEDDKGNLGYNFNPYSFYDWYVIGGRWTNYLNDTPTDINQIDTYSNNLDKNVVSIKYYREFLKTHKDKKGYYIVSYKEDNFIETDGWKNKDILNFLKNYDEEDKIVVIDCHN